MKGKYDIMILSTCNCHCRISHLIQFVFNVDKEFLHDIFGQQSIFVVIINFFPLLLPVYILCLSAAILLLTVCTEWNVSMCSLQRHTLSYSTVHQQLVADVFTDTVVMKCKKIWTKWNRILKPLSELKKMDSCLISVDGVPLSTADFQVGVHTCRRTNHLLHIGKILYK